MSSPEIPPGWYPAAGDRPGTVRYWDGTTWTTAPVALPGQPFVPRADLADPWARIGARVIDGLITSIPGLFLVVGIIGFIIFATSPEGPDRPRAAEDELSDGEALLVVVILVIVILLPVLQFLYEALFVAWKGATPGKMICGIRAVNLQGERVSTGAAYGRAAIYLGGWMFGSWLYGIAALVMLWADKERKTPHDHGANTLVVRR